jgi:anaphase-promoting complex subunit 11
MCGICRAPFDGNPPEANFPGDDAPVVWGVCSHAFHIQCINKWLSSQPEQKCPFCRRPWEFKQAEAMPSVPVPVPVVPAVMPTIAPQQPQGPPQNQ